MSQNYIIISSPSTPPQVIISNKTFEKADIKDTEMLVSAGRVTFKSGIVGKGVEVDITHGNIALAITVDTNQAVIDKQLIEKLFL
jgi:hypothetical protein